METPRTLREIADLAVSRNGGQGGRALGRAAEARGLTLSYTTVDKIRAGKYTSRPSHKTLQALSVLSGEPLEAVYDAAGVPLPLAPLADSLPEDADLLDADQRRVVIELVRVFAKQNRVVRAPQDEEVVGDGDAAPMTPEDEFAHAAAEYVRRSREMQAARAAGAGHMPARRRLAAAAKRCVALAHELDMLDPVSRGLLEHAEADAAQTLEDVVADVHDLDRRREAQANAHDGERTAESGSVARDESHFHEPPPPPSVPVDAAARNVGTPSLGQQSRERQDVESEAPDAPAPEE